MLLALLSYYRSMTRFNGDDVAQNITNEQRADAAPTPEELEQAQEEQDIRKNLVATIMERSIERDLINHVLIEPQRGYAYTKPTKFSDLAEQVELGEEYNKYLKDCDMLFITHGIRGAAERNDIPVQEGNFER